MQEWREAKPGQICGNLQGASKMSQSKAAFAYGAGFSGLAGRGGRWPDTGDGGAMTMNTAPHMLTCSARNRQAADGRAPKCNCGRRRTHDPLPVPALDAYLMRFRV